VADLDRVLRHDQLNRRPRAGFTRRSGRLLGRKLVLATSRIARRARFTDDESGTLCDIVFEEHHIRAGLIRRVMLPRTAREKSYSVRSSSVLRLFG